MIVLALFLALLILAVYMVGGVYTPAGVILIVAGIAGWLIVHRARRRRGSAAQL
jgi:hypothetical protein